MQNLIEDPDVDALYIALPNSLHAQWTDQRARGGQARAVREAALRDAGRYRARARDRQADRDAALGGFRLPVQRAHAARQVAARRWRDRRVARDPVRLPLPGQPAGQHQAVGRSGGRRAARRRLLSGPASAGVLRRARQRLGRLRARRRRRPGRRPREPPAGDRHRHLGQPRLPGRPAAAAVLRDAPRLRHVLQAARHDRPDPPEQPVPPRARRPGHALPGRRGSCRMGSGRSDPSFTPALRHINAVLAGTEQPRLLALETSLATARALHDLAASFGGTHQG